MKLLVPLFLLLFLTIGTMAQPMAAERFTILDSGGDSINVRYVLDQELDGEAVTRLDRFFTGFSHVPGAPVLPREICILGVPAGVDLRLSYEIVRHHVLDGVVLPVYEEEGTRYRSLEEDDDAGQVVRQVGEGWVRSQRVAAFCVNPVRYDADSRRVDVIQEVILSIDFEGAQPEVLFRADPMGSDFERSMRGLLVNYDQAREWRADNRQSLEESAASLWLPRDEDNGEWYKFATEDAPGITRIGSQLDLVGEDHTTFRVWNQGRQIDVWLVGIEDGSFDAGDYLEFYTEPYRENDGGYDPYTDANVYWFQHGEGSGRRFQTMSAPPAGAPVAASFTDTIHFEDNKIAGWPEDNWLWEEIRAYESKTVQLDVVSPDRDAVGTASVTVHLHGATDASDVDPDHHVRIYLNGRQVGDVTWDGLQPLEYVAEISHQDLLIGQNQLRMDVPGDTGAGELDAVWLNWVNVTYQRRFVAHDDRLRFRSPEGAAGATLFRLYSFDSPVVHIFNLTSHKSLSDMTVSGGGPYTVEFQLDLSAPAEFIASGTGAIAQPAVTHDESARLAEETNQADYIIVTNDELMPGVTPLVQLQEGRGYSVMTVDVEDIYDEFSCGLFHPPAIQSFMEFAFHHWQAPAPQFLLLVGDATWDYKGYLPDGVNRNLVPSYGKDFYATGNGAPPPRLKESGGDPRIAANYDYLYGEAMVDEQMVCVSGSDNLPDMYWGRLAVDNLAELAIVVDKSFQATSMRAPENWRKNLLFITGGFNDSEQDALGLQVTRITSDIIQPERSGLTVDWVNKEIDGYDFGYYEEDILREINEGKLMVTFLGHAGSWSWESMFDFNDIDRLGNHGRLPFVLSMTCNTVRFANPLVDSFGEHFVNTANADYGAAALWGGCNFGGFWSDYYLAHSFLLNYFHNHLQMIGAAIHAAKTYNLLSNPSYMVIIEPYTYLGDPALTYTMDTTPSVVMGGYFDKRISASTGGELNMLLYGMGLEGIGIADVELYYDGIPTGVYMVDDGTQQDFGAGDGVFGLYFPLAGGQVPLDTYLLEAAATDFFGNKARLWPYLEVPEE
ncbi:hypothetical protein JW905_05795 [bacterium]|nr:hypothetical protein [candidate division CSSED10-310 bacterium]